MLIVVGWLYVVLMMAVAEVGHVNGSVLGAIATFVLYGVGPVALIVYLMGRPARRAARRRREAETAAGSGEAESTAESSQPDGGGKAAADAVTPERKEP